MIVIAMVSYSIFTLTATFNFHSMCMICFAKTLYEIIQVPVCAHSFVCSGTYRVFWYISIWDYLTIDHVCHPTYPTMQRIIYNIDKLGIQLRN